MELAADDKPIFYLALDPFDHPVLASSGNSEAIGQPIDSHMMTTGDPDFSFTVNSTEDGIGLDYQRVSMVWILGIAVRNRVGEVNRNMVEEVATFDHVDQLQTNTDG